jgi:hypothetical protein
MRGLLDSYVSEVGAKPLRLITADRALSAYGDLVTFIG